MEKIKSLGLGKCPHCGEEILVEMETDAPKVICVLGTKEIETAKKSVIEQILKSSLDEKEANNAINWVNQEDVVFGPSEVEGIVNDILSGTKEK